jgi:MFS family permease
MSDTGGRKIRWYEGLTKYHWWVLIIAVMSWMFDCMDQRLFVLSRAPAVKDLLDYDGFEQEKLPAIQKQATTEVDKEVSEGKLTESERQGTLDARVKAKLEAAFNNKAADFGNIVTALMVIGWSVGGFGFGIYGDRLGRVKTLAIAIFVYSVFTGLSGLSVGLFDFCLYRFLMGCGIGGAFATAATLIAETMPDHSRATALGLFQSLSALGNIGGSCIAWFVVSPDLDTNLFGMLGTAVAGWRILFMIGVLPALLVALIMRTVKEPDAWHAAKKTASDNLERQMGDIKSLFAARWRRNTLVGLSLAVVGVIGLWGVGFYSPELIDSALDGMLIDGLPPDAPELIHEALQEVPAQTVSAVTSESVHEALQGMSAEGVSAITPELIDAVLRNLKAEDVSAVTPKLIDQALQGASSEAISTVKAAGTALQDVGALLGMLAFTWVATRMGRKLAFGMAFLFCWMVVSSVFIFLREPWHAYVMLPLLGFATLSVFGGYSIYFPELYPTRLRASGTGLCYNVGRVLAALVIILKNPIRNTFEGMGFEEPFRSVSLVLASVYLLGLVVLIWAPETRGKPLPTDDD